jgi:hypothetical protein
MAINESVIFEYCMHPRTAHTPLVARPYCAVSGPVTGLVALARKNDL